MSEESLSILPGTVSFLALNAVAGSGPLHGFQILRWIQDTSEGAFQVEEGALYPALHRMEKKGWMTSEWAVSEKGRRAKYYAATAEGRRALRRKGAAWDRYMEAIGRIARAGGLGR